ncbi:MAG: tetratricopeptide repeat protein [Anaerolineales bacterium]|nr:tetratricopeptide repeat protein [Anaerolineales bacterium]
MADRTFPGTLLPGQRLAGRYRIEALIGRGGMGTVYRARDEETERDVAIKVILSSTGGSDVRRFRREFRVLARLAHPHIINVFDSGQVDGLPFYVMEYIKGPDLRLLLTNRKAPLPFKPTITIGIQVAEALAHIHNQGIVHRDLKPSNIMVLNQESLDSGQNGVTIKLMDFGLVKMADISAELTTSGILLGTITYLAPEQMKGLAVDRRADLYSLGLVLYESSTKAFPFKGTTPMEIAFNRVTGQPSSPRIHNPQLPTAFDDLVMKLLAPEMNERYASAEEVLVDLAPLADRPVLIVTPPPPRADIIARSPLIGREQEMSTLRQHLENGWQGQGKFVLLEGEAGVGKTRLVQELAALARQNGGRCLQGNCYEHSRIAYGPFVEILEDALTGLKGFPPPETAGLEEELSSLVPSMDVTVAGFVVLEPEQAQLRLFDAVSRFITRLTEKKPVLLLLDDLQWADDSSLALLHYLLRNNQAPVFVCGAARREELDPQHPLETLVQGLSRRNMAERLSLKALSQSSAQALVTAYLAGGAAPAELAGRLNQEAEGNPFFMEEMIKAWIEEGQLVWKNGCWKLEPSLDESGISALSIPSSIADIIRRRLRELSQAEQNVLDRAAVLGREFNFDVLLFMQEAPDEDVLLDVIDNLLRARLLEEIDHPREDRYQFAHGKIREVIYAGINRRRVRRLHLKAGLAIEKVYANQLDQVMEPMARHLLRGGERRGIVYGIKAGDAARAVYANQEALDLYRKALGLTQALDAGKDDAELIELGLALESNIADITYLIGEYGQSMDALNSMLQMITGEETVSVHRRLAAVFESQGRYQPAMEELQKAKQLLPHKKLKSHELSSINKNMAWIKRRQGDLPGAIKSCWQGLEATPADERTVAADLYDTLGVIQRDMGDLKEATTYHRQSLALREEQDDRPGIAKTCNNLAAVSWLQGKLSEALDYFQRSLSISEKIGHSAGMASVYNNIGLIYFSKDEFDSAIENYQKGLALFDRIGNQQGIALAYGNLGEAYWKHGELEKAIEHVRHGLALSSEIGDQEGIVHGQLALVMIYLEQEDIQAAIDAGIRAVKSADELGAPPYQARALRALGESYMAAGEWDQARSHLDKAVDLLEQLNNTEQAAQVAFILQSIENLMRKK